MNKLIELIFVSAFDSYGIGSGLVVTALDSGLRGLGSSLGSGPWAKIFVMLGKILFSHGVPLYPRSLKMY